MVALGGANVGIALWLNIWNRDFFNALEKRDLPALFELLWILAAGLALQEAGVIAKNVNVPATVDALIHDGVPLTN